MKILIAGDSFAAEWPGATNGWVNLLANKYSVTNVAQAGCGEYRILKQLRNENLYDYDLVIVSHTSPSRVYTPEHPLHKEGFHKNCDLIANDIDRFALFNDSLKAAQGWFKYHYNDEYQLDMYELVRDEINRIIKIPYISISHIEYIASIAKEKNHLNFSELWGQERGDVNHYTPLGNITIFDEIEKCLKKMS